MKESGLPVQIKAGAESAPSGTRILALDGIRGLAALLVLFHHAFHIPLVQGEMSGLTRLVSEITKGGWLGVDLFFVLSGFLITGILLDQRCEHHYFRNFYARRVLRIVPLYFLALLVLLIFYQHSGSFVLLGSLYLTNFAALFGVPMLFGPLWSLSVEEHFYLLWPGLVRWLNRRNLWLIVSGIIVLSPLARLLSFEPATVMNIYFFSWFRFDGLAWGALLALLMRSDWFTWPRIKRTAVVAISTGVVIVIAGLPFGILSRERLIGSVLLYSAMQMIFAGTIAIALLPQETRLATLLTWRPLTWCGKVSYCFYLVHVFCFHTVNWLFAKANLDPAATIGRLADVTLRAVIGTVAAFIIAALSWRYLESPVLSLKRHFTHHPAEIAKPQLPGLPTAQAA